MQFGHLVLDGFAALVVIALFQRVHDFVQQFAVGLIVIEFVGMV